MIRKFRAETEDAKQKVFTTKAKTLGINGQVA
nr:MAG: hypothetical protein [Bacteriophage sp.]